ncbi:two-component system, OmpR family, sensor kinase [Sanguibacter gelidistatuariae]|uniref:histidine kinase n=1 Tax=Sanguibacter gelidistatuariae TaxID=1814289 RepID=A0A1G6PTI1_9MICO|nr:HAMP domain-containing sensor histidine kinase [Sanguibacter gelidistatuariae]SDC83281.1 two-component system, OmpR family, sensor kinase [Sanguibacter gelidistatuariae]
MSSSSRHLPPVPPPPEPAPSELAPSELGATTPQGAWEASAGAGLPAVPPPPQPPTTGDAGGQHVGPIRSFWVRTPLRVRLVGIVTLVLLAGLGISVVLTTTVLSRFLVDQLDTQLTTAAQQRFNQTLTQYTDSEQLLQLLPSDFYIAIYPVNDEPRVEVQAQTIEKYGIPKITAYTFTDANRPTRPFTTSSVDVHGAGDAGTQWRVLAGSVEVNRTKVADVYVALPLTTVESTVGQIKQILLLSALAITVVGAAVGLLAVRRSLRPLGDIERTAAAIAEGDLSRRIPQGPLSTEVGSLAHSLNVMLSQIEQGFAAREASEARMRRFVSDASHELRTPLATVRGYGELYRMGALTTPEAMDDTMRRIEDSAKRMGTLVEDLLHLARLDEGRAIQRVPVDLTVLAADAVSDLHALDPSRPVRLAPLTPGAPMGPCLVIGDDDRLRQVFANLVGNVAMHTPTGSPVEVALGEVTTDGRRCAVLEVRDHGPGISDADAERIFERFYRVDSSRNRTSGGSGLGLAIVAAIVGSLEGTVSTASTPGGGLTVRICLPAATPGSASVAEELPLPVV